jgi:rhamnose utilization protein RhaD (predicted bifunctional aldolase and dehydrogenase)
MSMSEHSQLLEQLIQLSRAVGKEERNLAILGEGNTSALAPGGATFWVKASGSQLGTITQEGFTQVKIDAVLALCEREEMSELEIQAIWPQVQVDPAQRRPSLETFLHALCLTGWPTPTPSRATQFCAASWAPSPSSTTCFPTASSSAGSTRR